MEDVVGIRVPTVRAILQVGKQIQREKAGCPSHLASKDLNVVRRERAKVSSWVTKVKLRQSGTSHVSALLQHRG